ncbi:MAG: two-component system, chemotaxis family, sensor kinase CheA [Gaiellaceae bacterium]|nr:two-component system, chemotaxis family, sensor kinase CheA [Gaiellaceae bacterium]
MSEDTDFLEIFREEANERLDTMVDSLLALEAGSVGADAIDALFRDAHTIKGGAGMLGLDDVRTIADAVEDVLSVVRDAGVFPLELTGPLLHATDVLRNQVQGTGAPFAELLVELAASRAALVGPDPAPAARVPSAALKDVAAERRTVRVPAEKIDDVLDLVGEVMLYRRRLGHALGDTLDQNQEVADELSTGARLLDDLKDAAIGMRTVPLASILGPLPRQVRDLALKEGKEVELVMIGADTELDRVILENLAEPLVHVLRNAVGHGIESPAERKRAKKPPCGRVELRAEQHGSLVEIVVSDDGRGVSAETQEDARREGSLADVLTRPGYSTAGEVTDLSGRGVGLDAVKAHIESFGGSVDVRSEPGRGTEVVFLLPLALALLDVLLFERGNNVYGLSIAAVEEALTVGDTFTLEGRRSLELRGRSVPLYDLAHLIGADAPALRERSPAIVVSAGGRRIAGACDALVGEEEVVVKPLGPLLADVEGYVGAAILGDGRVALLLDASALTRGPRRGVRPVKTAPDASRHASAPKILVVEDSFTVRELQKSILEAAGYRVVTARDGRDALDVLDRDEDVDLVLTDLEMPELDGLELTVAIRNDSARASMPVVIVTSLASDDDRRRGIEAGADAYMSKRSFDQHALLETVQRLVGR